jgi:hypothetical protein
MLAYVRLLLALILLKLKWHAYTTFRFLMRRAPKVCPCFLNFDKSYSLSIQFFCIIFYHGNWVQSYTPVNLPLIFSLLDQR